LVQASWALIWSKAGGKLKERYEYMTIEKSKSKKKAIVAVARRLAELMYTMMRDGTRHVPRLFMSDRKEVDKLAQLAMSA
jgi:transposase